MTRGKGLGHQDASSISSETSLVGGSARSFEANGHAVSAGAVQRTCIMVLGMHRSGTSALTGLVSLLGAGLPKQLLGASPTNPTGHWEPQLIANVNDRLLAEGGSSWDDWRPFDPKSIGKARYDSYFAEVAQILSEEFEGHPLFLLKEPRICRIVPFYTEVLRALNINVRYVLVHRNPLSVGWSLEKRNQFNLAFSHMLWLRYQLDAERSTRNANRVILSYEGILDDWRPSLARIVDMHKTGWLRSLEEAAPEVDAFLSREYEHHPAALEVLAADHRIPRLVKDTAFAFRQLTFAPSDQDALSILDGANLQLDKLLEVTGEALFPEMGRRTDELHRAVAKAEILDTRIAQMSALEQEREARIAAIEQARDAQVSVVADLRAENAGLIVERAVLKETAAAREVEITQTRAELRRDMQATARKLSKSQELLAKAQAINSDLQSQLASAREMMLKNQIIAQAAERVSAQHAQANIELQKSNEHSNNVPITIRYAISSRAKRLARNVYYGIPVKDSNKAKTKSYVLSRFPFLFSRYGFYQRWKANKISAEDYTGSSSLVGSCLIVTTPHAEHIARMMASVLNSEGFKATVAFDVAQQMHYEHIFALCPQFFPGVRDGYVAVQLEQHVSSKWINDEYAALLGRAAYILDYSRRNISFLSSKFGISLSKFFHLPIGLDIHSSHSRVENKKDIDVLFYGDVYCGRRKKILGKVKKKFNVKVINDVFGREMDEWIRRSKVVLNIHYYEQAILETPRIFQSLSLGTPVVSEVAADMDEHPELQGVVDYVPLGDANKIVSVISSLITKEGKYKEKLEAIETLFETSGNSFSAFFRRFLFAARMIPYERFAAESAGYMPAVDDGGHLCLSLPETTNRRSHFESQGQKEFEIVNGLKAVPGWIGCAYSYKYMFEQLLGAGVDVATICEDDVVFPSDYATRKLAVDKYLKAHEGKWDIFSGFVADLGADTVISHVEEFEGVKFLWIDKCVSMVFNTYNKNGMMCLSAWSPEGGDVHSNTIDRYMERNELRVVMAYPFLVGHHEDQFSTIWGFKNTQYHDHIERTDKVIQEKLRKFEDAQSSERKGSETRD